MNEKYNCFPSLFLLENEDYMKINLFLQYNLGEKVFLKRRLLAFFDLFKCVEFPSKNINITEYTYVRVCIFDNENFNLKVKQYLKNLEELKLK